MSQFTILEDNREQKGWSFDNYPGVDRGAEDDFQAGTQLYAVSEYHSFTDIWNGE